MAARTTSWAPDGSHPRRRNSLATTKPAPTKASTSMTPYEVTVKSPMRKRTGYMAPQYSRGEGEHKKKAPGVRPGAVRSGGGGGSRTHVRRKREEDRYRLSRLNVSPASQPPTRKLPGKPPSGPRPGSRRAPGGATRDQPALATARLPPAGGDLEGAGLPKVL